MAYRNKTYVIFDGDEDMWAYAYMLGWISKDHIAFDFHNATTLRLSAQQQAKRQSKGDYASVLAIPNKPSC